MSDNKAIKGVGLLAMMSLMFARTCKTCEHESATFIREGTEVASHEKVKPSEGFSCNRTHVNDVSITPSTADEAKSGENSFQSKDEVFLKKMKENEYSYTDNSTINFSSLDNSTKNFSSLNDIRFNNSKTLIVDGNLTEDEIKTLNKKGVKFICNREVYEKQKNITKYQIIFIFSEDRKILKDLYSVSEEQVDDVIKIAQPVLNDKYVTKVGSKQSLDITLALCRANNITPVIVFNNKNKTLFDYPLSYYGVSNAITCNSYNLGSELFFSSTDYIGINNVVSSLVNNNQPTLFDFYKNFSNNYSTQLYFQKQCLVTIVATSTAVTGGGAGFIIYYNLNERT